MALWKKIMDCTIQYKTVETFPYLPYLPLIIQDSLHKSSGQSLFVLICDIYFKMACLMNPVTWISFLCYYINFRFYLLSLAGTKLLRTALYYTSLFLYFNNYHFIIFTIIVRLLLSFVIFRIQLFRRWWFNLLELFLLLAMGIFIFLSEVNNY